MVCVFFTLALLAFVQCKNHTLQAEELQSIALSVGRSSNASAAVVSFRLTITMLCDPTFRKFAGSIVCRLTMAQGSTICVLFVLVVIAIEWHPRVCVCGTELWL